MQVRGKSVYLSGKNGVLGNRVIAGTAGDRPQPEPQNTPENPLPPDQP